jgi:diguanylate cyclase (GGDEF)-like protein
VGRSWRHGTSQRVAERRPAHVGGPYYARHAVAVPVGQRHVVVYGAERPIRLTDGELIRRAAADVDGVHGVSADKLLADELELVHALRDLMAYRPTTVRDTLRHIATVAGRALSCEVAVVRIEQDGGSLVEGLDLRSMAPLAAADRSGHLGEIDLLGAPIVEQAAAPEPDVFGVEVVARMTLPLGSNGMGALALGHAVARPRGFTLLCQRIGRALADAAELLISQARAREELATERDLLARLVRTDPLTGGPNRRAWEDEVTTRSASHGAGYVLSCDIDRLKEVNDRFGHAAGDALIRAAFTVLRASVRDTDLVARVGGDEFVVFLPGADSSVARAVTRRIACSPLARRVTEQGIDLRLSVGSAPVVDGDLEAGRTAADRLMYACKRRRTASRASLRAQETARSA